MAADQRDLRNAVARFEHATDSLVPQIVMVQVRYLQEQRCIHHVLADGPTVVGEYEWPGPRLSIQDLVGVATADFEQRNLHVVTDLFLGVLAIAHPNHRLSAGRKIGP